jgi:hypothetical protein
MALTDSLIAYYSLDEASGNAIDAHAAFDLTETSGTIASAAGIVGTSRDFELTADTEYFVRADEAGISVGDEDFTVCAWINAESLTSNHVIFAKNLAAGNQQSWRLRVIATTFLFQFSVSPDGTTTVTSVSATTFGAASTATWIFIVAWHDAAANTISIQVNDGTVDSTAHTTGVFDSTAGLSIGAGDANVQNWDGLIDECGYWRRVLTSGERTSLYNGGAGLAYPLTVAGGAMLLHPGMYGGLGGRGAQPMAGRLI